MPVKAVQITKGELEEMVSTLIEQKLYELLGDLDKGLPLRKKVRERLIRQKKAVTKGERGRSFDKMVQRLGLE